MDQPIASAPMTRDEFFAWAAACEGRYEFDGFQPVAMTGGTLTHSLICQNLYLALGTRLRGSGCRPLGPDAGVATTSNAVRYPDALVTCTEIVGDDPLVPAPVVIFGVLSPSSGRADRIDKLREYRAIASVSRYVVLEHASASLTVYHRSPGSEDWIAHPLTATEILPLPDIGIEIPVAELYDGIKLPPVITATTTAPTTSEPEPDRP